MLTDSQGNLKPTFKWLKHVMEFAIVFGIPISILIYGHNSEQAKLNQEYVRLAVSVLIPPDPKTKTQTALREWAVNILQDKAPVKFSDEAVKSLISGETYFPRGFTRIMGDYSYNYPDISFNFPDVGYSKPSSGSYPVLSSDKKK